MAAAVAAATVAVAAACKRKEEVERELLSYTGSMDGGKMESSYPVLSPSAAGRLPTDRPVTPASARTERTDGPVRVPCFLQPPLEGRDR